MPRDEFHLHLAHFDDVAGMQIDFGDGIAVDQRAVGGVQIAEEEAVAFALDDGLRARHQRVVGETVIVIGAATESRVGVAQLEERTGARAGDDLEARQHAQQFARRGVDRVSMFSGALPRSEGSGAGAAGPSSGLPARSRAKKVFGSTRIAASWGQARTQLGSGNSAHRSHTTALGRGSAFCLRCCPVTSTTLMLPYGQSVAQLPQPMHQSSITISSVSLRRIEPTGQRVMQSGSMQARQLVATR